MLSVVIQLDRMPMHHFGKPVYIITRLEVLGTGLLILGIFLHKTHTHIWWQFITIVTAIKNWTCNSHGGGG